MIREQERILEAMPKPRKVKSTQPILDVGKLRQALSQATEYHQVILQRNADLVKSCELAIEEAQRALDKAKSIQIESQAKATRQIQEIKELVQKKQEETKQVIAPAGPPTLETQDNPDQSLMVQEVQNWLVQQQCPDHIKGFLSKMQLPVEILQPTQPSPVPETTSGAGVDLGGANGGQMAAMWEAA